MRQLSTSGEPGASRPSAARWDRHRRVGRF